MQIRKQELKAQFMLYINGIYTNHLHSPRMQATILLPFRGFNDGHHPIYN